jgi:tRNA (cmo5U34)-methyltransferase
LNDLESAFSKVPREYDAQRLQLIPCFNDFYQAGLLADSLFHPPGRILDLGCGTGLFAGFAALKYPEAALVLVDVSEEMVLEAKKRLSSVKKIQFIRSDFLELKTIGTFDLVISGLAIHHLEDTQKQEFFQRIYGWLKPWRKVYQRRPGSW